MLVLLLHPPTNGRSPLAALRTPGNRLEPLFELGVELFERRVLIAGLRGVKIEYQNILGVEAQTHGIKFVTVRTNKPAATTSRREMPICATTRTWLNPKRRPKRWVFPCDSLARVSLRAGVMSTLVACRAGTSPKKIPLTKCDEQRE